MNRKTFIVLALAAVVLGAIALFGQQRGTTGSIAGASAGELLLPGFPAEAAQIRAIEITGAGNERLVSLGRDGESWTVAEQGGYPADPAAVNSLLIALAEARIVEEKTANPGFHARLGVETIADPEATGLEVALVTADGERLAVVLGDTYTGGQRYARPAGSDLSLLVDRNPDVARDPSGWVDPAILDIDGARVQQVTITHADGETLVLRKDTADDADFIVDDIPEGRELQYASIGNTSATVLQDLELDEVAAAASITGEEIARIEYRLFDGLIINVLVTADADANPWLAISAEAAAEAAADEAGAINARLGAWQFRIPSYKYTQLTRRMDALLRALPAADE